MSESLLKIWARRIHEEVRQLWEFEVAYGRAETNRLYKVLYELYGDYHEPLEGDSPFKITFVENEEM